MNVLFIIKIIVEIGSVLAMGFSIGHGLTGASTFAIGSFLTMLSIIVGVNLTLKYLNA